MNGQRPCRFIVCEDEVMRCDTNSKLKTVPLADHGCIVDRIDPVAEIEQIGVMTLATDKQIVATSTDQDIITLISIYFIVVGPTMYGVIASSASQPITAVQTANHIVTIIGKDGVIEARPNEIGYLIFQGHSIPSCAIGKGHLIDFIRSRMNLKGWGKSVIPIYSTEIGIHRKNIVLVTNQQFQVKSTLLQHHITLCNPCTKLHSVERPIQVIKFHNGQLSTVQPEPIRISVGRSSHHSAKVTRPPDGAICKLHHLNFARRIVIRIRRPLPGDATGRNRQAAEKPPTSRAECHGVIGLDCDVISGSVDP